ncbi:PIN domain-containing protein [Actinoplanes sp. NPDC023714]|uniref:PIN domain-containing protein n=1 Tax=Actinoplanes sp. NPDC023714 TaxID=3154322 RepID=UPI0033E20D44
MTERYLVDTSALVRLARDQDLHDRWRGRMAAGVLSVCPITELEIFYTARSLHDRRDLEIMMLGRYAWTLVPDVVFARAREVQELLTERGAHRSAGVIDLLLAATAEALGLTILHYDRDFLQVSAVTGQPTCWVADPGSVD